MARQSSQTRRQEQITEARQRLDEAINALRTSQGWQTWLNTRSRFHSYSFHNCLLIASQRPTATRVAGYRQWQKLNRQVMKNEHGIRIFGFSTRKPRAHEIAAGANPDEKIAWFPIVSVFDISQTKQIEGAEVIPLEPPSQPINGDTHIDHIGPLVAHADDIGFRVEFQDLSGKHAGGWCDSHSKLIVVDENVSINAQVRVLLHELAHAHGVGYDNYSRQEAEVIADATAFICCDIINLDVSGESVPYIAGWASEKPEMLKTLAENIDQAVREIMIYRETRSGAPDLDPAPEPIAA